MHFMTLSNANMLQKVVVPVPFTLSMYKKCIFEKLLAVRKPGEQKIGSGATV